MREDAQKVGDAERMQLWAGQSAKLAQDRPAGVKVSRPIFLYSILETGITLP